MLNARDIVPLQPFTRLGHMTAVRGGYAAGTPARAARSHLAQLTETVRQQAKAAHLLGSPLVAHDNGHFDESQLASCLQARIAIHDLALRHRSMFFGRCLLTVARWASMRPKWRFEMMRYLGSQMIFAVLLFSMAMWRKAATRLQLGLFIQARLRHWAVSTFSATSR